MDVIFSSSTAAAAAAAAARGNGKQTKPNGDVTIAKKGPQSKRRSPKNKRKEEKLVIRLFRFSGWPGYDDDEATHNQSSP
jgi:hypothetical protein